MVGSALGQIEGAKVLMKQQRLAPYWSSVLCVFVDCVCVCVCLSWIALIACRYSFGDTKHPNAETVILIEKVVHTQITEIVSRIRKWKMEWTHFIFLAGHQSCKRLSVKGK